MTSGTVGGISSDSKLGGRLADDGKEPGNVGVAGDGGSSGGRPAGGVYDGGRVPDLVRVTGGGCSTFSGEFQERIGGRVELMDSMYDGGGSMGEMSG